MNFFSWIILFIFASPAAFLLAGAKIAGKLLKVVLLGYLITTILLIFAIFVFHFL